MTMYIAEIQTVCTLVVWVETTGDYPTDEEVFDEARYTENHVDSFVSGEKVTRCMIDEYACSRETKKENLKCV